MFNNAKDKNVKAFSTFASSSSITYNFVTERKRSDRMKTVTQDSWYTNICTIQLKVFFQKY